MENVFGWSGKYWEPMPIENYDDPNNAGRYVRVPSPRQAAGVVHQLQGRAVRRAWAALAQKTENRGFNRGTEMERQVGSTMKGCRGLPVGH